MNYEIYALGRAGKSLQLSIDRHCPHWRRPVFNKKTADLLFLTVPDDQIGSVAQKLAQQDTLPPLIAHVSGVYSHLILEPLQDKTAIAQFHPLAALTGLHPIPEKSLCAISSDQAWAQQILTDLAHNLGLIPVSIRPDKVTEYHAAAVLTGNLTLALVLESVKLMQKAGIHPHKARLGLSQLLHTVADNIAQQDILEALSGPVARRDFKTLQKHGTVLNPEVQHVYQVLSSWLLSELQNHKIQQGQKQDQSDQP